MPPEKPSNTSIDFRNPRSAQKKIETAARLLGGNSHPELTPLLRQLPDPDAALDGLLLYLESGPYAAEVFRENSQRLAAALTVFAHSRYLTGTLVRYPELLPWALEPEQLQRLHAADELRTELGWLDSSLDETEAAVTLARFKRMQILRIALRDLLGLATMAETTIELSNLADAMLQGAHAHIRENLMRHFGRPLCLADSGPIECDFAILALGKLGGRELNYSSDIDLMYLFTGDGETSGPVRISNREFMTTLARRLTDMLSRITPDGFSYRVDLRLRPEGRMGEMVTPLDGAVKYYNDRARDWELQMLIKARPVAGGLQLGETFLQLIDPLIYHTSTDFSAIEKVTESRDRIEEKLRSRRNSRLDVKLARGGIRDIEFLVQCLQRLYGGQDRWVRSGGTLFALQRLWEKRYLAAPDYSRLSSAYQFLRTIEHHLQLDENRQTHKMPDDPAAQAALARKAGAAGQAIEAGALQRKIEGHLKAVLEIYERVIRSQPAVQDSETPSAEPEAPAPETAEPPGSHSWKAQLLHIDRTAPQAAEEFRKLDLQRGAGLLEHLLNRLVPAPELLAGLDRHPRQIVCLGDLIEHSPYLAKYLISFPEHIRELRHLDGVTKEAAQQCFPAGAEAGPSGSGDKRARLRRIYRRWMLRILAQSICRSHPIFETLETTSALADAAIQAAYDLAAGEVFGSSPPGPDESLHVIALGRLGMREFDHASDADLVFVLPDASRPQKLKWRRVVEHLIDVISSYTREGTLFSVDPRLRPMGGEGELVQTESYVKSYFENSAQAWEALTYMKARTVAGGIARGSQFLTELQEIGWKRFGLDTGSRDLLYSMRERLEKEQGHEKPIKAGAGGYYDIDFILMYLRLREAGIFFESLNTPQRIEVLRSSGALSPQQGKFLLEAAVFYRALDHAIRVSTGHSSSRVPAARAQQRNLAGLIGRWSHYTPHSEPLGQVIRQVRQQTRDLFLKIFG